MPPDLDTSCPFCGARLKNSAQACPDCDLPLLGPDGEHPAPRPRALFDGAALFDEAFTDDSTVSRAELEQRLATKRRGRRTGPLRCVVVALNQAEAEMLCDMLRSEGLACMIRSPELQSYGQSSLRCDVMVPEEDLQHARELLRIEAPQRQSSQPAMAPHLFTLVLLLAVVLVAAIIAILIALGS